MFGSVWGTRYSSSPQWSFGPFRLDLSNSCLWHGMLEISLKPKTFAVLHQLVAQTGRLMTIEELFATVWPATAIGDAVLKVYIGEVRKALGIRRRHLSTLLRCTVAATTSSLR
jgi:DNA-binding response OmpR family regulator